MSEASVLETKKEAAPPATALAEAKVPAKKPAASPSDSELTRDDFVLARNCCIVVGFVVVAGIIVIGDLPIPLPCSLPFAHFRSIP